MSALKFPLVAMNAQEMHAQFPGRKSSAFPHSQGYLEMVCLPGAVTSDHARQGGTVMEQPQGTFVRKNDSTRQG